MFIVVLRYTLALYPLRLAKSSTIWSEIYCLSKLKLLKDLSKHMVFITFLQKF